jgi:hypothetical protein
LSPYNKYVINAEVALQWVMVKAGRVFEEYNRKTRDCLKETVGRNMGIKGNSGEDSERR